MHNKEVSDLEGSSITSQVRYFLNLSVAAWKQHCWTDHQYHHYHLQNEGHWLSERCHCHLQLVLAHYLMVHRIIMKFWHLMICNRSFPLKIFNGSCSSLPFKQTRMPTTQSIQRSTSEMLVFQQVPLMWQSVVNKIQFHTRTLALCLIERRPWNAWKIRIHKQTCVTGRMK